MVVPRSFLGTATPAAPAEKPATRTPIERVIVLFQENISFDHYFATYPSRGTCRASRPFMPHRHADGHSLTAALAAYNPNTAKPFPCHPARPRPATWITATRRSSGLQWRADGQFVEYTHAGDWQRLRPERRDGLFRRQHGDRAVWNYAQHFSLSDNSFRHQFRSLGPRARSTHLGQTHGATPAELTIRDETSSCRAR